MHEPKAEAAVEKARTWISKAERIVVLTGAGISTDSGIPDFRGPKGVWTRDPKAEKTAHISYYLSDPEVRKRRWQLLAEKDWTADPNAGHHALVALERRGKLSLLITQNVDGLHQLAGTSPELIVEVHGNTRQVMCLECDERAPMERALRRVRAGEEDPPCRSCGGILKSATISFGQALVQSDLQRAELAAKSCDLLLAVGSTLAVYPVAAVVPLAKQHGARIAILNGAPTAMDEIADVVVRGAIGDVLPRLCSEP